MENTATFFVDDLTIYTLDDENYFVGKEICELLEYKNAPRTLEIVSPLNKILFKDFKGEKTHLINSKTILITKNGIEEILNSNRTKDINKEALCVLDLYDIHVDSKEDRELTEYSYFTQDKLMFEYFVGYEVATLLGYKNPNQTVKDIVSKSNQIYFKDYVGEKIPPLNPKTVLITRDGVIEILLKTRKRLTPDVEHILKKFNITTTNRKCLSKEQQCLSVITDVFKTEKFEDQYNVGKYRLDLYFPEHKIVIECDENGHESRKPWDEKERMDFVNKELNIDNSYWVRFNPDEYGFEMSRVVGNIHSIINVMKDRNLEKILEEVEKKDKKLEEVERQKFRSKNRARIRGDREINKEYIPPTRAKKNIDLELKKSCNICEVVKPLNEFNPASEHRDGRENVCIECRRKRQAEILVEKKKILDESGISDITCNICEKTMPFEDFYRDKLSPTGHMRRCKMCHKSRMKVIGKRDKLLVTEKTCKRCNVTKIIKEFNKRSTSTDGYNLYCRQCVNKL